MRVRLTRFPDRNTEFIPVLDARPGAAANGGTTLSGWVGDDNSAAFAILFSAAWFGVVTSALLGVGIALLVSGHLIGLALAVAFPLPAAWYVRGMLKNRQPRGRRISEFLESVNEVLGSTVQRWWFEAGITNNSAGLRQPSSPTRKSCDRPRVIK